MEDCKTFATAVLDNRLLRAIGTDESNNAIQENRKIIKEFMGWCDDKTNEDYCRLEDDE